MAAQRVLFLAIPAVEALSASRLFNDGFIVRDVRYSGLYFLCLFVQIVCYSIWRVIIKPSFFSRFKDLPEPPERTLLHGHFWHHMSMGNGEAEVRWLASIPNDGMMRCRGLFNSERIVVSSPTALARITTDSFTFVKPNLMKLLAGRVLGLGLVLVDRDIHKQQRKLFLPPFAPKHIRDLIPTFWRKSQEVTDKMTEEILEGATADQKTLEIGEWAARVALDIITLTGMGKDFGAVQDHDAPLARVYMKVLQPTLGHVLVAILKIVLPARLVEALPIKSNHDQADAYYTIRGICRDLLREKKQGILDQKMSDSKDIISVCLRYGEITGVDEDEVVDQMTTFLGAGHETISVGITWAVYMWCLYPDWQRRLREEVRAYIPASKSLDLDAFIPNIESMPLMRAFVEEVLRRYPPIPTAMRESYQDTELDGRVIPKGTRVIVPIKAINREKKFWGADADHFKPERWLKSDGKTFDATGGVTSKYGHLSFMQGPRSCVAATFSRAEMTCVLAAWVSRFEFNLADERFRDEGNMETSKGNFSAKPLHGMWTNIRVLDQ